MNANSYKTGFFFLLTIAALSIIFNVIMTIGMFDARSEKINAEADVIEHQFDGYLTGSQLASFPQCVTPDVMSTLLVNETKDTYNPIACLEVVQKELESTAIKLASAEKKAEDVEDFDCDDNTVTNCKEKEVQGHLDTCNSALAIAKTCPKIDADNCSSIEKRLVSVTTDRDSWKSKHGELLSKQKASDCKDPHTATADCSKLETKLANMSTDFEDVRRERDSAQNELKKLKLKNRQRIVRAKRQKERRLARTRRKAQSEAAPGLHDEQTCKQATKDCKDRASDAEQQVTSLREKVNTLEQDNAAVKASLSTARKQLKVKDKKIKQIKDLNNALRSEIEKLKNSSAQNNIIQNGSIAGCNSGQGFHVPPTHSQNLNNKALALVLNF